MSATLDVKSVPVVVGTVAGVAAWVSGYVCAYLIAGTRVRESGLNRVLEFLGEGTVIYKLVGWVFFNSHFVDTVFEGAPVTVAANTIGGDDGFTTLLFLVPPALLVAAGLAVARYEGVATSDAGIRAGLSVVPAYFLLSILGAFVFTITAGPATGRPDLLLAAVLAGVVYPAVFGAAGGALAGTTAPE